MKILMYSRDVPYCPFCAQAKELIKRITWEPVDLTVITIGKDITREEFMENFPEFRTIPQIYVNDRHIGGYDAFAIWYAEANQIDANS